MLPPEKVRKLKNKAHSLKPVILLGAKGLTPAVQREITIALKAHELIKIRLHEKERAACEALIQAICTEQEATFIQHIGHIITIYKQRAE